MKTIQQDLKSNNVSLNEATDVAQNHPLWRLDWLIDWSIEQCFTSPPTQYRLHGRQFYRSEDPTNSIKVLKEKTLQKKTQKMQTTQNTAVSLQQ